MDDIIKKSEIILKLKTRIMRPDNEWDDGYNTGMAEAVQLIENEPTAFCMIPCSEKMPDKDGKYLVLLNNNAWDILDYDTELEQFGWTDDYKDEFGYNITEWYDSTKMVVSWMPLPEKL